VKYIFIAIGVSFPLFCLYTIFIWGPVNIYTEAKCLKAGYPEHRVSVGLEMYCLNLQGDVTVNVDQLK